MYSEEDSVELVGGDQGAVPDWPGFCSSHVSDTSQVSNPILLLLHFFLTSSSLLLLLFLVLSLSRLDRSLHIFLPDTECKKRGGKLKKKKYNDDKFADG